MDLPACLTKFNPAEFVEAECKPRRFYEAIVSRPTRALQISETVMGVWSKVPMVRCVLSREGLEDRQRCGFLICILREFDETPA